MNICGIPITVKDARNVEAGSNYEGIPRFMWLWKNSDYTDWSEEGKNYKTFLAELKSLTKICDDDDVKIVYLDDDNDEIPIECDIELREALHVGYFIATRKQDVMTLIIKKKEKSNFIKLFTQGGWNAGDFKDGVKKSERKPNSKKMCSDSNLLPASVDDVPLTIEEFRQHYLHDGGVPVSPKDDEFGSPNKFSIKEDIESNAQVLSTKKKVPFNETPEWFKSFMKQFKTEILQDVKTMIDDALVVGSEDGDVELKSPQTSKSKDSFYRQLYQKAASSNDRTEKWMRKFEELHKKEEHLDHRIEKMEKKKLKMLDKLGSLDSKGLTKKEKLAPSFPIISRRGLDAAVQLLDTINVAPGEQFTANWTIINSGSQTWTEFTELRHMKSSPGLIPPFQVIKFSTVRPTFSEDISISFVAPEYQGIYLSKWLLFHAGIHFGPWVEFTLLVTKQPVKRPLRNIGEERQIAKGVEKEISKLFEALELGTDAENFEIGSPTSTGEGDIGAAETVTLEDDGLTGSKELGGDSFVVPMPACFFPNRPPNDNRPVHVKYRKVRLPETKGCNDRNSKETNEARETLNDLGVEAMRSDKACLFKKEGLFAFLENEKSASSNEQMEKYGSTNKEGSSSGIPNTGYLNGDKASKTIYSNDHRRAHFQLPSENSDLISFDDPAYYRVLNNVCGRVDGNPFKTTKPEDVLTPQHHPPVFASDPQSALPPVYSEPNTYFQNYNGMYPQPSYMVSPSQFYMYPNPLPPPPPPTHIPDLIMGYPDLCEHPNAFPHYHGSEIPYIFAETDDWWANIPEPLDKPAQGVLKQGKNASKADKKESSAAVNKIKAKHQRDVLRLSDGHRPRVLEIKKVKLPPRLSNESNKKPKLSKFMEIAIEQNDKRLKSPKFPKHGANNRQTVDGGDKRLKSPKFPKFVVNDHPTAPNSSTIDDTSAIDETVTSNESESDSNVSKQPSPVSILPESIMNGAINVASSAYNSAVNVLYGLRPRVDNLPEFDDEKMTTGLVTLFEMGFTDTAKNAKLLKQYNYNIAEIVENYCVNRN